MIWLIIILAIIVVSFFLAIRSMRTYKEIPTTKYPYGVFLIQNESLVFEDGILNKLYEFCSQSNAIVSLERLFNGPQKALVLFAPQNIGQYIPELALLEIEDYLAKNTSKTIDKNNAVVWSIKPKDESKLILKSEFMKNIQLEEKQNFFWQIIMTAAKEDFHFQVNIRAMIIDPEVQKRVELAKTINSYITEFSSLEKNPKSSDSITLLFDEYQKRVITPSEAEGFILSSQTIKQLL